MQDGIIKGVGNSRFLKSVPAFLTLYPTYEAFAEALIAGTLPVDLNGINEAGWTQLGTALNKANLLSDATAGLLGGDESMTPDGALRFLAGVASQVPYKGNCSVQCFTYTGTGVGGSGANSTVISFQRVPTAFVILPMNNLQNNNYGNVMLWGLGSATKYIACGQVPNSNLGFSWWQVIAGWSGAVLSFYHSNIDSYGHYQLNFAGAQYMVIALYQES